MGEIVRSGAPRPWAFLDRYRNMHACVLPSPRDHLDRTVWACECGHQHIRVSTLDQFGDERPSWRRKWLKVAT